MVPGMVEDAEKNGRGMDPRAFVRRCHKKLGALGLEMAIEQVMVFHQALRMSLFSHPQIDVWDDTVTLSQLFNGVQHPPQEYGVIVTTSTLSPGAKTTTESRGYPIRAVERDAVAK